MPHEGISNAFCQVCFIFVPWTEHIRCWCRQIFILTVPAVSCPTVWAFCLDREGCVQTVDNRYCLKTATQACLQRCIERRAIHYMTWKHVEEYNGMGLFQRICLRGRRARIKSLVAQASRGLLTVGPESGNHVGVAGGGVWITIALIHARKLCSEAARVCLMVG